MPMCTASCREGEVTGPNKARERPADAAAQGMSEFVRAENEDDDGYDPYSDRRPDPEPLFERDPWD